MKKVFFLLLFLSGILKSEETFISKADTSFNNGNFKEALELYKEYLLSAPEGEFAPLAQYRIGEGLFQLEKYAEAKKGFNRVISIFPKSEYVKPSLSRLGDCYLKLNKKLEAIEAYQRLKNEFPDTKEGEYALSQLSGLLPKKPTKDEIEKIKVAKELFEKGSYTGSYDKFLSFIKDYKNSTYTPYARFKLGESLYYQEKYDDAIKSYNDFLISYPDTPYSSYAEYSLSFCYFKIGDFDNASKTITGFLEKNKTSKYYKSAARLKDEVSKKIGEKEVDVLFNSCKNYFKEKNLEKAKAGLDELLEKYPDNRYKKEAKSLLSEINEKLAEKSGQVIKELYDRGENYLKEKKYDAAIDCFQRLVRDFPETDYTNLGSVGLLKANKEKLEDEAGLKYNEGLTYEAEGKEHDARIIFQGVISRFPTTDYAKKSQERLDSLANKKEERNAESLYKEGVSLLKNGNYEAALGLFEKIIVLYPSSIYSELSKKRRDKIKEKIGEDRQKSQFEIAMKYYELGEYKESAKILQNIISIWPSGTWATKAKNVFSEISDKLNEEDASSLFKMAQSYYENNEFDKAFDVFKKIVELYPQSRFAKVSILAMGRLNEKIANEKAKEIFDIGQNLMFQKKYDESYERFDKVSKEYPTSYWAQYAQYEKGECNFLKNDYQNAILEWQGVITQFPESSLASDALYHIAGSYALLNMKEDASKMYKRLLLEYPESIYAKGQLRSLITEKIK